MQRYFAKIKNNIVTLGDDDVHHLLHVMRARVKDEIEVVDNGKLFSCSIDSINPLIIKANYEIPIDSELPTNLTLFFALAKGDKIEFVIQKATELGATRIVLIKTERCVVKFDDKDFKKKLIRYQRIAKEASEQSHRLKIPEIQGLYDLKKIPEELLEEVNLLAYEKAAGKTDSLFNKISHNKSTSVMIGPEGGFSEAEVEHLIKHGFDVISLGKRILRTETAAVYALSVIGFLMER